MAPWGIKRIEEDDIPAGAAPYRIMEDIENYNKLGGMKKQLYDIIMQINVMREILLFRLKKRKVLY